MYQSWLIPWSDVKRIHYRTTSPSVPVVVDSMVWTTSQFHARIHYMTTGLLALVYQSWLIPWSDVKRIQYRTTSPSVPVVVDSMV